MTTRRPSHRESLLHGYTHMSSLLQSRMSAHSSPKAHTLSFPYPHCPPKGLGDLGAVTKE